MNCPNCQAPLPQCAFCGDPLTVERPGLTPSRGPFAGITVHRGDCEAEVALAYLTEVARCGCAREGVIASLGDAMRAGPVGCALLEGDALAGPVSPGG